MRSMQGEGEETVITSIADARDGFMMAGTAKDGNYRVLILKTDEGGKPVWKKTHGHGPADFEGQGVVAFEEGFLVCGCSEGRASESGGRDWKAYLLKVDADGERLWERSFLIKGNDCAYSLVADKDILLFGEARDASGNCHLFLMRLNDLGEEIWRRTYCGGKDVIAGGILPQGQGLMMAGSLMREGRWRLHLLKVDADGKEIWERSHEDILVYDLCRGEDGVLLAGSKYGRVYLAKIDDEGEIVWEKTYDGGCGVTVCCNENEIVVAGSVEAGDRCSPVFYKADKDGEVDCKRIYDKEGFVEKARRLSDGYMLILHRLAPKEHAEILLASEDGLLR